MEITATDLHNFIFVAIVCALAWGMRFPIGYLASLRKTRVLLVQSHRGAPKIKVVVPVNASAEEISHCVQVALQNKE